MRGSELNPADGLEQRKTMDALRTLAGYGVGRPTERLNAPPVVQLSSDVNDLQ